MYQRFAMVHVPVQHQLGEAENEGDDDADDLIRHQ